MVHFTFILTIPHCVLPESIKLKQDLNMSPTDHSPTQPVSQIYDIASYQRPKFLSNYHLYYDVMM